MLTPGTASAPGDDFGRMTDNAQINVAIHPTRVHPKRRFTAAMAPIWWWSRWSAMTVGTQYSAMRKVRKMTPTSVPQKLVAASTLASLARSGWAAPRTGPATPVGNL